MLMNLSGTRKKRVKISKTFTENYDAEGKTINKDNFRDFVII